MIWLQPIDDTRFDRQCSRNQKLFEAITGERNLPIVSLVTTKWSNAGSSRASFGTYKKREVELKKRWAHLLDKNAQLLRDDDKDLLNMVLKHSKGESPLALQEELVTNKWSLAQTASGKILSDEFRTDYVEEDIAKMLDQILIDRKNGTPNKLLVSDAQRAYDSYVKKREAKRLLDEWTFEKSLFEVATQLGIIVALATSGIALAAVFGGTLLYEHMTRKPLPVGDAYTFDALQLLIRIIGHRTRCKIPGLLGPTATRTEGTSSRNQLESARHLRQDRRRPPQRPFDKTRAICKTSG